MYRNEILQKRVYDGKVIATLCRHTTFFRTSLQRPRRAIYKYTVNIQRTPLSYHGNIVEGFDMTINLGNSVHFDSIKDKALQQYDRICEILKNMVLAKPYEISKQISDICNVKVSTKVYA